MRGRVPGARAAASQGEDFAVAVAAAFAILAILVAHTCRSLLGLGSENGIPLEWLARVGQLQAMTVALAKLA
ncbi:hypothetical protein GCM10027046_11710 [Uliginosibacterium flavum]